MINIIDDYHQRCTEDVSYVTGRSYTDHKNCKCSISVSPTTWLTSNLLIWLVLVSSNCIEKHTTNSCLTRFNYNCRRDHWGVLVSHGWTQSSAIWEPTTSRWTKQSTWLRTVICGGWYLCMAIRTPSGACQKRRRIIIWTILDITENCICCLLLHNLHCEKNWRQIY